MKRCQDCGALLTEPKPYQRLCDECARPERRKKNHEDLKQIYANVRKKTEPKRTHWRLSIVDAQRLSKMTRSKLSYGQIIARYGSFDFDSAQDMMGKDGYIT